MLYARLPRELRDQIYSYLIDVDYIYVTVPEDEHEHSVDYYYAGFDIEFVGKQVAKEIAEYCYRNLQIRVTNPAAAAAWLQGVDQHGFVRADVIRSLRIEIFGHDAARTLISDELVESVMLLKTSTTIAVVIEGSALPEFYAYAQSDQRPSGLTREDAWDAAVVRTINRSKSQLLRLSAALYTVKARFRGGYCGYCEWYRYDYVPDSSELSVEEYRHCRFIVCKLRFTHLCLLS
jgi:hypothetical protein